MNLICFLCMPVQQTMQILFNWLTRIYAQDSNKSGIKHITIFHSEKMRNLILINQIITHANFFQRNHAQGFPI